MEISIPDFLSLAVDPIRLALLGSAARDAVDPAGVADDLGTDERRVRKELGRLMAVGLIDSEYRLDHGVLRDLAQSIPTDAPIDPSLVEGPWTDDEAHVLSRFFTGRRLTQIPSGHSKRLLVLERLALEFEPGVRYQEREVDFALQMFYSDYASLRRHLVDEGMMTRADGATGAPEAGSPSRPRSDPPYPRRPCAGASSGCEREASCLALRRWRRPPSSMSARSRASESRRSTTMRCSTPRSPRSPQPPNVS